MHPHLMGDFPVSNAVNRNQKKPRKPYLVN
jgi:hypothetical protein